MSKLWLVSSWFFPWKINPHKTGNVWGIWKWKQRAPLPIQTTSHSCRAGHLVIAISCSYDSSAHYHEVYLTETKLRFHVCFAPVTSVAKSRILHRYARKSLYSNGLSSIRIFQFYLSSSPFWCNRTHLQCRGTSLPLLVWSLQFASPSPVSVESMQHVDDTLWFSGSSAIFVSNKSWSQLSFTSDQDQPRSPGLLSNLIWTLIWVIPYEGKGMKDSSWISMIPSPIHMKHTRNQLNMG